jgi:hypothetical protein
MKHLLKYNESVKVTKIGKKTQLLKDLSIPYVDLGFNFEFSTEEKSGGYKGKRIVVFMANYNRKEEFERNVREFIKDCESYGMNNRGFSGNLGDNGFNDTLAFVNISFDAYGKMTDDAMLEQKTNEERTICCSSTSQAIDKKIDLLKDLSIPYTDLGFNFDFVIDKEIYKHDGTNGYNGKRIVVFVFAGKNKTELREREEFWNNVREFIKDCESYGIIPKGLNGNFEKASRTLAKISFDFWDHLEYFPISVWQDPQISYHMQRMKIERSL